MRLLFLYPAKMDGRHGGREQLSRLHRRALADILNDQFFELSLRQSPSALSKRLAGQVDGADSNNLDAILQCIDVEHVDTVWLDGANLGWLASQLKRQRPSIRIITFAHNVEAIFFRDSFKLKPSIRSLAILDANRRAERLAMKHSDLLIAISDRDSTLFDKLYGRAADVVLPIALPEPATPSGRSAERPPYLLFVGVAYYANLEGIEWYARTVAPRIDLQTLVIGREMDADRLNLNGANNVEVIGEVEDLSGWYEGALAIVAPIFRGSGMKTKVAEAWMFGKRVIGTAEAHVGYDPASSTRVCDDADDFVEQITTLTKNSPPPFDQATRLAFEKDHSFAALQSRLRSILRNGQ